MALKKKLAGYLRVLAYMLDQREFINARWHKTSVEGMNRYIAKTERYVTALEQSLEETLGKRHVCGLRREYNVGAWKY